METSTEEQITIDTPIVSGMEYHEGDLVDSTSIYPDDAQADDEPIVVDEQLQSELLAVLEEDALPAVVEENLPAEPEEPKEVLEVIKDVSFPDFEVYKTTHGWWSNVRKVELLIDGLKRGGNIISSCIRAGISRHQYYYFLELHPDFSYIIEACEHVIPNMIDDVSFDKIKQGDVAYIQWYATHRDKRFKSKGTGDGETEKPNSITNNTTNVVIGANDKQVKKIVSTIADSVEKQIERESLSGSDTGLGDDMEESAEEAS